MVVWSRGDTDLPKVRTDERPATGACVLEARYPFYLNVIRDAMRWLRGFLIETFGFWPGSFNRPCHLKLGAIRRTVKLETGASGG